MIYATNTVGLRRLTNWLIGFLVLSAVIELFGIGHFSLEYSFLNDVLEGKYRSLKQLTSDFEIFDTTGWILMWTAIITFVVSAVLFLTWVYRANSNVKKMGAVGMRFSPGASVGWYFVPFLNYWKPYQAMKEIWKASKNPLSWKVETGSNTLRAWWFFVVVGGLFNWFWWRAILKPQLIDFLHGNPDKVQDAHVVVKSAMTIEVVGIVGSVISVMTCIAAIILVNSIYAMQESSWKRLSGKNGLDVSSSTYSRSNVASSTLKCPSCHTYQFSNQDVCPNCGHSLWGDDERPGSGVELDETKIEHYKKEKPDKQSLEEDRQPIKDVGERQNIIPKREFVEFPYMAELNRSIYAYLLKEKKDAATMLQATVECGGDKDKIETTYYKLRYAQIIESGTAEKLKAKILAEKETKDALEPIKGPTVIRSPETTHKDSVVKLSDRNVGEARQVRQTKADIMAYGYIVKEEIEGPIDVEILENRDKPNVRFSARPSGVVRDNKTGLEWVAGPDRDTTWYEAKEWVRCITVEGRWRMPSFKELETLYETGAGKISMMNLLKTGGHNVWSSQKEGREKAWICRFPMALMDRCLLTESRNMRALAVRF